MMRRTKILLPLVGALTFLTLLPEEVAAQPGYGYGPRPVRPRWGYRHRFHGYVGGQLMGMGIMHQTLEDTDVGRLGPGGGFGLFGGLRLGPFAAIEINWAFTGHDESWQEGGATVVGVDFLNLQTLTADFKLHIPTRGLFEPFLQAGVGFAFLGVSGDYAEDGYILASGGTWALGGGGDFWFSPFFTLGGRVLYRGMYFTENEYGIHTARENRLHGISFEIAAAIHF
jgi:hypothetical protein